MKTYWAKPDEIEKKWFVVDADNKILAVSLRKLLLSLWVSTNLHTHHL